MAEYLSYWKHRAAAAMLGKAVEYAGSQQYAKVNSGAVLWIVTQLAGRLLLVAPLVVDERVDRGTARRRRGEDLWDADWHVFARPTTAATAGEFDMSPLVGRLRFHSPIDRLPARPSAQHVRVMRALTPESVRLLRDFWKERSGREGAAADARLMRAVENTLTETWSYRRGRSRQVREEALRRARGICAGCDVQYGAMFEGRGRRILQVHHKKQLAADDKPRLTHASELCVVCANCHLLIHADPAHAMSLEKLRRLLRTTS